MPFRQRAKHFFRGDKDRLSHVSRASTPDQPASTSENLSASNNNPRPITPVPVPSVFTNNPTSPSVPAGIDPNSNPQPAISIQVVPPAATVSATVELDSNPTADTALPGARPILSPASNTTQSAKHTAWAGLKILLGLLNESADAFGPLKSAVGGISRCIEIFEVNIADDLRYHVLS
jgi:hypothetical protein